jgi:uncharacterized protein
MLPKFGLYTARIRAYHLSMQNFWEQPNWWKTDKHLLALKEAPFERVFPSLKINPGLFIIRGPRQVGKTSWLKTILKNYPLSQKAFYLSCENIPSYLELAELLKSIVKNKDLIIFDEISFVKEWSRAIKHAIDSGYSGTIIVTGSHSVDIRRGLDQMPGRFGAGGEFLLMPMAFDEFVAMRKLAKWEERSHLENLELFFRVGGFPSAVIESGEDGKNPVVAKDIYSRWLVGDTLRLGKQERYLKEVLSQVAIAVGSQISLQKLAQKTQLGSHHTAQEYLSILEDCFALRTCFAIDPNSGAARTRKEKKFYFTDPLIFWIALECFGFSQGSSTIEQIAEMVAHEELYRRYSSKNQRIGYFSSSKGEVDFYNYQRFFLEVKWSQIVRNLSQAYQKFSIPEKIVWSQENFLREWPKG